MPIEIKFPFTNDVAPEKVLFVVILYSEAPILCLSKKNKLTNKVKEKFVILQLIRFIAIKVQKQGQSFTYTSRYSSGNFNPYNSANS